MLEQTIVSNGNEIPLTPLSEKNDNKLLQEAFSQNDIFPLDIRIRPSLRLELFYSFSLGLSRAVSWRIDLESARSSRQLLPRSRLMRTEQ